MHFGIHLGRQYTANSGPAVSIVTEALVFSARSRQAGDKCYRSDVRRAYSSRLPTKAKSSYFQFEIMESVLSGSRIKSLESSSVSTPGRSMPGRVWA